MAKSHVGRMKIKTNRLEDKPVPCPYCGTLTRAKYRCPHCGKHWDINESRQREIFKRQIFAGSDLKTRKGLRKLRI